MSGIVGLFSGIFKRQVREATRGDAASDAALADEAGLRRGTALFANPGTLYAQVGLVYKSLCESGSATITIERVAAPGFEYVVHVLDTESGSCHLSQTIADGLAVTYQFATASIHWSTLVDDVITNFAFRFGAAAKAKEFVDCYNQCVYSSLMGVEVPNLDDEESAYVASTFSQEVPAEVEEEEGSPRSDGTAAAAAALVPRHNFYESSRRKPVAGAAARTAKTDDDDYEDDEEVFAFDEAAETRVSNGGGTNCCFADSVRFQRAIVVKKDAKGQCIIVANPYDERGLVQGGAEQFTLPTTTNVSSKEILLEGGDSKLLMVNANDMSRLLEVDLECGKVVQEYRPGSDSFVVQSVTPHRKFADLDPSLFTCLGQASAFTIDTRLNPEKCAVVEDGADLSAYTLKLTARQRLTCHATSQNGYLAIGDAMGQIRLYSGPPGARRLNAKGHYPKTAKTLLKATTNNPITHIDISADGAYILATCDKFLLVLCTLYMEAADKVGNGFASRMGKSKPMPLRLSLDPAQAFSLGGSENVHFTAATFQSNSEGEKWIAAGCGPVVATWNFAAVRRALDTHRAVQCELKNERAVVRSVEVPGSRDAVLFLTDNEVGMEVKCASRRRRQKQYLRFN